LVAISSSDAKTRTSFNILSIMGSCECVSAPNNKAKSSIFNNQGGIWSLLSSSALLVL